nr:hypothetical protein [Tanacetum cinerariifolium]
AYTYYCQLKVYAASAKTTTWNEFSSTMATAIISLATNQKFNFSKYNFDHRVKNLEDGVKFLMFPRFVQVFLDSQVEGMLKHKEIYVTPPHTKKIFANMKRHGKDFSNEHVTTTFNDLLLSANQALEIGSLKRRMKKLEKKANKKTHKLKRLYKIGSLTRVESSEDVGLGDQEDASKQGRMISDLDADEGEVSIADPVPIAGEVVTTAGVEVRTAAITSQIAMDEITLAKALIDIKTSKIKEKGIVMQDPSSEKAAEGSSKREGGKLEQSSKPQPPSSTTPPKQVLATGSCLRTIQDCLRLGDQKVERESQKIGKEAKGKNPRDEALQDCGETKVFDYTTAAEKDVNAAEPDSIAGDTINAASVNPDASAADSSTSVAGPFTSSAKDIFEDEMTTMADTLMAIWWTRPRTASVVIHDVEEEPRRAIPLLIVQSQDKGKGKMVEPEPISKEKATEQQAKDVALIKQMEDIQARIDVDALLVERL